MLNLIDIVLAVLLLLYLLKNAGGLFKIVRAVIFILIFLVVFAIVARLLIDSAVVSGAARQALEESYFVKASTNLIAWAYPAVRQNAPKIDEFIKDKVISATTEVAAPKVEIPKMTIPEKDVEKFLNEEPQPAKKK